MKRIYIFLILSLFILLSACQQNNVQPDQNSPRNPFLRLSNQNETTGEESVQPDLPVQPQEVIQEEAVTSPGYGVPQADPNSQPKIEKELEDSSHKPETFKLPFGDFKERWNALTNEQGTELIISSFEKVDDEEGQFHKGNIRDEMEIRVFVEEDKVHKIQMINASKKNPNIFAMLMSWSQVVYMMNPSADPHHVDEIFYELKVGPNLDVEQVEERAVQLKGIQYYVKPSPLGFLFEARYVETNS